MGTEFKTIEEVLDWCRESIEMEGNVPEETLIDKLKEIYDFLYITDGGNYYLITYPKWFELLNRYREKMGEEYTRTNKPKQRRWLR